jgi:hypothetical protein
LISVINLIFVLILILVHLLFFLVAESQLLVSILILGVRFVLVSVKGLRHLAWLKILLINADNLWPIEVGQQVDIEVDKGECVQLDSSIGKVPRIHTIDARKDQVDVHDKSNGELSLL